MGRILLVGRLVGRDLRRRPGQALLLLLAITAATATLTLGLVLHGVTSQPYQQTRAATHGPGRGGPSLRGQAAGPGPGQCPAPAAQVTGADHAPGVTGHSGPYPVASAVLRARGITDGGRGRGPRPGAGLGRPAEADRGQLGAAWRRGDRAHLRRRARRRRRRPGHPERPAVPGGRDRGHRRHPAVPEHLLHCGCVFDLPGPAASGHRYRPDLAHRAGRPRLATPRRR